MTFDLSPVVAATATWLTRAYPAPGGTFSAILAERQARQAVGVAGLLRYPDAVDVELVLLLGPGGAGRLDWLAGTDPEPDSQPEHWRSWVDEVLASWAACLLGDAALAAAAVAVVARDPRRDGPPDFRRLTAPDACDRHAAALLRHPDLLAPVADLHRPALLERLDASRVEAG